MVLFYYSDRFIKTRSRINAEHFTGEGAFSGIKGISMLFLCQTHVNLT